jgi:hypothetical protein
VFWHLAIELFCFSRLTGVTSTRYLLLGENRPWNRVRFTLGLGTSAASLAMKSSGSKKVTWEIGSDTNDALSVYGTLGTAAVTNVPVATMGAIPWTDASGNLWLFGGGRTGY